MMGLARRTHFVCCVASERGCIPSDLSPGRQRRLTADSCQSQLVFPGSPVVTGSQVSGLRRGRAIAFCESVMALLSATTDNTAPAARLKEEVAATRRPKVLRGCSSSWRRDPAATTPVWRLLSWATY